jgi:hypothetical protein
MRFGFEFDAKNNVLRGTIKDPPETIRLSDEIMKLLIKRQTSLADGSDALTTVMLNALKANYGREKANEFDLLLSHYSEEVRKFSESMKRDRFCSISNKRFAEWIEHDRVSMDEQANRELRISFPFSETALAPYRASTGARGHQPAETSLVMAAVCRGLWLTKSGPKGSAI